jgi:hypothetical protein
LLTVKRAAAVQKTAICLGDQLPRATTVDGLDAVPFLRLPQPSATIATDTSSVSYGGQVELSGNVTSSRATEAVTILAIGSDGTQTDVTTVPVDASGAWAATVSPSGRTFYRALSWSALSEPVAVTVSPDVVLTRIGNQLVAAVTPARPGASVLLERRSATGWTTAALATLDDSSQAVFRWNPTPGSYVLRAGITKPQAGPDLLAGQSALMSWNQPKPPKPTPPKVPRHKT